MGSSEKVRFQINLEENKRTYYQVGCKVWGLSPNGGSIYCNRLKKEGFGGGQGGVKSKVLLWMCCICDAFFFTYRQLELQNKLSIVTRVDSCAKTAIYKSEISLFSLLHSRALIIETDHLRAGWSIPPLTKSINMRSFE